MGNCLRIIIDKFRTKSDPKKDIVLLMTGLDNSGKTLVLKHLNNDPNLDVVPTMGFRYVNLNHKLYSIKVYDVGGSSGIRPIWKNYYNDIHGVIYVVDASDMSRLDENKIIFGDLISNENIAGKPILLLANKQDIPGAIDELDVVENLDVEKVANLMRCPTRVEICSCIFTPDKAKSSTSGIKNGYNWLLEIISKNYEDLNERVKATQLPPIVNNKTRRKSSTTSLSSRTSLHSNPFKPIDQAVAAADAKIHHNGNGIDNKKQPFMKKLLKNNKTAPMPMGLNSPINNNNNKQDDESHIVDIIESFQVPENNERISLMTLDPLNLINDFENREIPARPFTAPPLSYKKEINNLSVAVIPGQVPQ